MTPDTGHMTTTTQAQAIIRTDVTPENYEEVLVTMAEGDAGVIRLYECAMGDTRFWQVVIDVDLYEVHDALCATMDEALALVREIALDRGDGQECEVCETVSTRVVGSRDVYGPHGLYAVPDHCPWCPNIY